MVDVFSIKKRSEIMSRVKGRGNRATELRLIAVFRAHRIKGWRRHARIFGRPDFVFPQEGLAVFVDGCFWHGCPIHGSVPASNRSFWKSKLHRNVQRDKLVRRELEEVGWCVLRIWQHELGRPESVANKVAKLLARLRVCGGWDGRRKKNGSG
jgi:DNA mismatch endonuclease, patch repair protein